MSHETNTPGAGTLASLCLVLAAATAVPDLSATAAERAPAPKRSPNAALVYWQAFALLPDVDAKTDPAANWKKAGIDDKVRKLLKQADQALRLMHKASTIDTCDWGIDWSDGPGTLLPHLGKARRLARLAMLRARVRLADGQTDTALADIAAALRLGRQVGRDGVFIEMLVQFAIEGEALEALGAQLPNLTAVQRKALAGQLDRLPAGTDVSQAILAEKAGIVDWMVDRMRAGGRDALTATVGQDLAKMPGPLKDKTVAELLALLDDLGDTYAAVSRAAALPPDQAAAKLRQIEKGLGTSPNPFVRILLPTVSNIFEKQVALFKQRKALRARLSAPSR